MDNVVAKLLDLFKHISRDIMIYVISGFVVIINLYVIDKVYIKSEFFQLIDKLEYLPLIIFILSYIIGHIIMAFMEIISLIDPCIYKIFKFKKINFKDEVKIFENNKDIYDYFIERQNQLSYFRWTLAGAFFISTIINILYICIGKADISLWFIFLTLGIGIFLLILHYITDKEYKEKIDILKDINLKHIEYRYLKQR